MFDVTTSLIRYWEAEFPSLRPGKNNRGERKFTPKDIGQVELIFNLVKERGFTLEGAKKEISTLKKNLKKEELNTRHEDVVDKLKLIKEGLLKLKQRIDKL
ncbi:MAG: MerR family transcriptional regulator [Saprospiraceae bacterium]|nr:MerR family transcriptional regulator [Saprospiraceae bacterium]